MKGRIQVQPAAVVAALLFGAAGFLQSPARASADVATVTVTVTASPTAVNRGGTVIVTETITNPNGFSILQPTARLLSTPNTLTSYTSLVSCDAGPGGSCTTTGGGYEAIFGSAIAGYSSATATFTLSILPSAPGGAETLEGQLIATNFVTDPVPGQTITITPRSSSTGVSCSPGSVAVGQASTCTATVTDTASGTAVTPTGTVGFSSDSAGSFSPGASCTLASTGTTGAASCSVAYTPSVVGSGTHTITASYGGGPTHDMSSGQTTLTVTNRSTSTAVSCLPSTVLGGLQSTTCTATVADTDQGTKTTPTGTVSFGSSGPGTFGSGGACTLSAVNSSQASCSVRYTPRLTLLGKDTITAGYNGDSTHAPSTGTTTESVIL